MTALALPFYPNMNGYSENYEWPRSLFLSDSGKTHFISKQDPDNGGTEMPQFPAITVNASYTFTDIKQVRFFENLIKWGKARALQMPLWNGLMKIKSTISTDELELEQYNTNSGCDSIEQTGWNGTIFPTATSAFTFAQPDIGALRISASDVYSYAFKTDVASINTSNNKIIFTSAFPTGSTAGDILVPIIEGYLEEVDYSYSKNGPQLLTASITVRQK